MKVGIVADSACAPSSEDRAKLGIRLVPINIFMEGRIYQDIVELEPDALYSRLPSLKELPTTSAPSIAQFQQAYQDFIDKSMSVICFTVTSTLSGTYDVAVQARDGLDGESAGKVTIVDTRSAGAGGGVLVAEAARQAREGLSRETILQNLSPLLPNCTLVAMIDTLEYLEKSGRIGKVAYLAGDFFQLKPVIFLHEGVVHPLSRSRGKKRAMNQMLEKFNRDTGESEQVWVSAAHAGAPEDALELVERIKVSRPGIDISVVPFTPAMGIHAGPGLIGLGYTYL